MSKKETKLISGRIFRKLTDEERGFSDNDLKELKAFAKKLHKQSKETTK